MTQGSRRPGIPPPKPEPAWFIVLVVIASVLVTLGSIVGGYLYGRKLGREMRAQRTAEQLFSRPLPPSE